MNTSKNSQRKYFNFIFLAFTKRNSIKFPLFEGEKVTFEQKEEGKAILQFFKKIEEVFEKKKSKKNLEPLVIFIEGGKRGGERRKGRRRKW